MGLLTLSVSFLPFFLKKMKGPQRSFDRMVPCLAREGKTNNRSSFMILN